MAKKEKPGGRSLKERMEQKKKELASRGGNDFVQYLKDEGTYRVRILPMVDKESEFVAEVTSFYLGNDIGSVYSPSTFGEPCALMDAYNELKDSKDDEDKELAKSMSPRTVYVTAVLFYKDLKGKKVDDERSGKLLKISKGVYQQLIDLYLDEDEWGEINDPKNGYDIKITRTGKGKFDTEYDSNPCKNTPVPKEYKKPVDLEEMVKGIIASYDETVEYRDKFLGLGSEDEDEKTKKSKKKSKKSKEEKPKKGKSDSKKKSKKKKGDI